MTTQTPDAVREAILRYTQHHVGCAVYGTWVHGEPKCSCGLDEARASLAALDSRADDAGEGWKLVPVEMTREMSDAGRDATGGYPYAPHDIPKLGYMQVNIIWNAILSATPAPAVDAQGGSTVIAAGEANSPCPYTCSACLGRSTRRCENTAPNAASAPAVDAQEGDDEGPCTDCGDTGITIQTERACSCEAGNQYRPPAVDAVPAGEGAALASAVGYAGAVLRSHADKLPVPQHARNLADRCSEASSVLAALSHGEGRK